MAPISCDKLVRSVFEIFVKSQSSPPLNNQLVINYIKIAIFISSLILTNSIEKFDSKFVFKKSEHHKRQENGQIVNRLVKC